MNPLDDPDLTPLFHALCVICRAVDFTYSDDDVRFLVPTEDTAAGAVWAQMPFDVFDALVERGWLELLGEDEFQVTQGGKYHYARFEKRQEKAARGPHARRALSWRKARRS